MNDHCPVCNNDRFLHRWCDGPSLEGHFCAHGFDAKHSLFICSRCEVIRIPNEDRPCFELAAIDPGLRIGVAFWKRWADKVPAFTDTFQCPTPKKAKMPWSKRAYSAVCQFRDCLARFHFAKGTHVFVELPAFFHDAQGEACATKGDLIKLSIATGMILPAIYDRGLRPRLVGIADWKGQMPKELTHRRIKTVIGTKAATAIGKSSHAWDAVGIGLAARGLLEIGEAKA